MYLKNSETILLPLFHKKQIYLDDNSFDSLQTSVTTTSVRKNHPQLNHILSYTRK